MKARISNAGLFICCLFLNQGIVSIYNLNLSFKNIIIINCFLFGVFVLSEKIKRIKAKNKMIIFQSLSINAIRILACFVFLCPSVFSTNEPEQTYIYNFLIVYFIYLFFEIFSEYKKKTT